MKDVRVLVACEKSQRVASAFRRRGITAFSCDIDPELGGHPEWHIKGDAVEAMNAEKWDLLIAHPPCTFLTRITSLHLYHEDGTVNKKRYDAGIAAKEFFMQFYNANIPFICVENPTPLALWGLPPFSQIIQPYQFGEPYSKATCLWLKGLPKLTPTNVLDKRICTQMMTQSRVRTGGLRKPSWGNSKGFKRSVTFEGIAEAMADQWIPIITKI